MFLMVFGIVQCVFLTIDVFGANASRQAIFFPCNCCVLLFEHFTRCRRWHVCRTCLLLLKGGGWGRVTNNVPDDFKTVGHKGPCNFLFLFLLLLLLLVDMLTG